MPNKRPTPEQIIGKLREVEIVLAQGISTAEACRRIAVSVQTYYRWRKEYGGLKTDQARRMKDLEKGEPAAAPRDLGPDAGQVYPSGGGPGKLLSPARRRRCIDQVREVLDVSERRVCRVLGQHRSTQRKVPCGADDEEALTEDIIALAKQYGRYGYLRWCWKSGQGAKLSRT